MRHKSAWNTLFSPVSDGRSGVFAIPGQCYRLRDGTIRRANAYCNWSHFGKWSVMKNAVIIKIFLALGCFIDICNFKLTGRIEARIRLPPYESLFPHLSRFASASPILTTLDEGDVDTWVFSLFSTLYALSIRLISHFPNILSVISFITMLIFKLRLAGETFISWAFTKSFTRVSNDWPASALCLWPDFLSFDR